MTQSLRQTIVTLYCLLVASAVWADSPIRPGDHIAIVGNTFADQIRLHGYLETMLLQRWPDNPVSIRNLGWGGDMLDARDRPTNFPTEEATLTSHHTDVIVACLGMGESFAGEDGLNDFRSSVAAFVKSHDGKKYNGESPVRLVFVSPIANEPLGTLTPRHEQRDHELRIYTKAMGEVAKASKVPFINLYQPSRYLMSENGPRFTNNGIHLNSYGYWAISPYLFRELVQDGGASNETPWRILIDAKVMVFGARGIEISGAHRTDGGLRFQATELVGPSLPPPTDDPLPHQLNILRDSMTISNLAPGRYTLTIDETPVATATHDEWAEGTTIDQSPSHREAEKLRLAVNDKNLQFTYSWKALNQVHIVGERKRSPSGRALPAEVIEFDRIANERDSKLSKGVELRTRDWVLSRIGD